jgi:GTP-binding protein
MHGASGETLTLKVPLGTQVREYDEETRESGELLADLTHDGESVIVAKGGQGGRGNIHFVTSTRRAPAFAELGEPAEESWIELEMKLMADAALVGMPSVGKSSLIARMSAARPKIADYPFTTLVPNLGMVHTDDHSFVVADIPGLIEGAAEGRGLGHEFLRHIERTALILHVIDATGDWEGRDPVEDYKQIQIELENYAHELIDRPQIVVINKVDVPGTEEAIKRVKAFIEDQALAEVDGNEWDSAFVKPEIHCVSAVTGEGVEGLIAATAQKVFELRTAASELENESIQYDQVWEHKRQERDRHFVVRNLGGHVFMVEGKAVDRMVLQTEWENEEAIAFLQHRLERMGVEKALIEAGARDGDEIRILNRAFGFEAAVRDDFEGVIDDDE